MVDVQTLKEALDRVEAFFAGIHTCDMEEPEAVGLLHVLDAAREHVACLEGPTDEDVEIAWRSLNATGAFASRNAVRAALVKLAEARRQK